MGRTKKTFTGGSGEQWVIYIFVVVSLTSAAKSTAHGNTKSSLRNRKSDIRARVCGWGLLRLQLPMKGSVGAVQFEANIAYQKLVRYRRINSFPEGIPSTPLVA